MSMKLMNPIDVTEAVLTASDIAEPDTLQGEAEWTDAGWLGKSVPDISDGAAITTDGTSYYILGWDNNTLTATIYEYDASFVYQGATVIPPNGPYVSGDKRDICFDGTNFWFINGNRAIEYDNTFGS